MELSIRIFSLFISSIASAVVNILFIFQPIVYVSQYFFLWFLYPLEIGNNIDYFAYVD